MREVAYAKINLALHVRRRRADGYHELETIFAFAAHGDELRAVRAEEVSLTIDGPCPDERLNDASNLVLRAAAALQPAAGTTQGAALHLTKNLPIASGIGGGSADAAATLRLLTRLWGVNIDLCPIAASLGADVPACLDSLTARGEGVGETLTPLGNELTGTPVLLVNPRVPVSTGAVFKAWDGIDRGALSGGDDPMIIALLARNDLTEPACRIAPVIADVLAALSACRGVSLARMSGSGATCFAVFDSIAARDNALSEMPRGWWTMASTLR